MTAKRILVVDNHANIRSALKYRLEKEGHSVLVSGDGLDALQRVRAERPDLIIVDLIPQLDGFGFLERLRGDAESQVIPVVVLTSLNCEETRSKSSELGVVRIISKPFRLHKLVTDMERIMGCEEEDPGCG